MIKAYQDAEKYSITNSVPSKTSRMGVTAPGAARSSDPNNSSIIMLLQNTTTDVCILLMNIVVQCCCAKITPEDRNWDDFFLRAKLT